jgi:pSer/pThr/pTyr-binding forkhead associated (FHA) protein
MTARNTPRFGSIAVAVATNAAVQDQVISRHHADVTTDENQAGNTANAAANDFANQAGIIAHSGTTIGA